MFLPATVNCASWLLTTLGLLFDLYRYRLPAPESCFYCVQRSALSVSILVQCLWMKTHRLLVQENVISRLLLDEIRWNTLVHLSD